MTNQGKHQSGPYSVHVNAISSGKRPDRVGLIPGRTGVPLFVLFLEELTEPRYFELMSSEDVRNHIFSAQTPSSTEAWQSVMPFFTADGTQAHAVALPTPKKITLPALFGKNSGYLKRTGLQTLRFFQECVDLVCVPQAPTLLGTRQLAPFYSRLCELARELDFFVLMDLPRCFGPSDLKPFLRTFNAPNMAAFYPWLSTSDGICPPSPMVAAAVQNTDREFGINHLPCNRPILGGMRPMRIFSPAVVQSVIDARCNLIHEFNDASVRLWGGSTLSDPSDREGRLISASRTVVALKQSIEELCEPYVLEPMSHDLPSVINVTIGNFFDQLKGVFDLEHRQPFSTAAKKSVRGGVEFIEVEVGFRIPHAVEEIELKMAVANQ